MLQNRRDEFCVLIAMADREEIFVALGKLEELVNIKIHIELCLCQSPVVMRFVKALRRAWNISLIVVMR